MNNEISLEDLLNLPINERRKAFSSLTEGQLQKLAESMFCPVLCGGTAYVDGKLRYIHGGMVCTNKEHNDIIRSANPTWSDDVLKPYLLDEND